MSDQMSGNGNGSLATETTVGLVQRILISRIRVFPDQPRKYFDPDVVNKLAKSLKRKQRVPIKVMKITGDPDHDYEIIDGECRWRAAQIAEMTHILAWVEETRSRNEQFVDSTVSNFCRSEHTAIEKAEALKKMVDMGLSVQVIADECGYEPVWVYTHLALLRLPEEVRALMNPELPKEEQLRFADAQRLGKISDPSLQIEIAQEIVSKKISAKQTKFMIQHRTHDAGVIPTRSTSPNREFQILGGFAERLKEESSLMLGMPSEVFVRMLSSKSLAEVQRLQNDIQSSIEFLTLLVKKIGVAKQVSTSAFATTN